MEWLAIWGVGHAAWFVFRPILEDLARDLGKAILREIRENPLVDSPWMKEATAAEYLSMKQRGMQNHRRMGTGPKWCMPGGVIRYHRDDLDSYMRAGEGKSGSAK